MPVEFNFAVNGSEKLSAAQGGLGARLTDWRKAWPQLTSQLRATVAGRFEAQKSWAPLSPKYARRKERIFPGRPKLQASGRLVQSLAAKSEDSVEESGPLKLRLGTRLAYAAYHQSGTRRGMPPRAIFDPSAAEAAPPLAAELMRQTRGAVAQLGLAGGAGGAQTSSVRAALARQLTGPARSLSEGI